MKLNIQSLVRATLQIGGVLVANGIVTGHGADIVTQVIGYGSALAGLVWGQVNASQQTIVTKVVNSMNGVT